MRITQAFILKGMSDGGGWNRRQLELLGVEWPPIAGWKARVDGEQISDAEAEQFLLLKGMTRKRRKFTLHGKQRELNLA